VTPVEAEEVEVEAVEDDEQVACQTIAQPLAPIYYRQPTAMFSSYIKADSMLYFERHDLLTVNRLC
jgi:hypothetical protein